jgi:predicted DsbA family dithiol-disulfide isomerase
MGRGQRNIEAFNRAVFQAYFVHGRNIGQEEVLIAVAESAGLDPKEAKAVLMERPFESAVDADWERSRQMGIRAVPTFVLKDRILVGAQPETALDEFVRSGTGEFL